MVMETVNPTTGQIIQKFNEMSLEQVHDIIDKVHGAQKEWRQWAVNDRADVMLKAAEALLTNKEIYAKLITTEMGKPIKDARKEIEKCAWVCKYYVEHSAEFLKPRYVQTEFSKSYVTYQPLGIVLAIMPWNFPFWQVFRFAVPTLMAGNGALLKHAPICTGTALAIEKLLASVGFPENLFRSLIISNETAEKVIMDKEVAAVTLTGSGRAGRAVGSESAKALKKVVLELGGSDPYLILKDADLDMAAEACVTSRLSNSGQVCIGAKRLIVVDDIYESFIEKVKEKMQHYIMGDPAKEDTNFGPLARADIRDEVHKQVLESIAKGAKLIRGGEIPNSPGFYYPPTLLTDVKKGMPAYEEEIFGPVIIIIRVKDEDEAIHVANDTGYGLGAGVFTKDIERGEKIAAEKIQAGTCVVNTFVASDPRLPFGGIKESGYGRELSIEGIRSFTNVKTVSVK